MQRQLQREGAPLPYRAFDGDRPAVGLHDGLEDGESEPQPPQRSQRLTEA